MRFATKAIHVGQEPDPRTGAVTPPLYLTSTYSRKTQDQYAYARGANPTRDALQTSLAGLEGAKYALSFSSGMGAITTSLTLLKKGDDSISVCDNTFASPALQNPLSLGVDLVVHSTTKYIGGHADLLGGALVMNRDDLHEKLKFSQNALGAIPSAFDCWLTLRGIKTLAIRMEKHCDNAEAIAKFLKAHKAVAKVHYPGLPDDPGHAIAKKQMRRFGGMLSFEVRDPSRIVERFKRL